MPTNFNFFKKRIEAKENYVVVTLLPQYIGKVSLDALSRIVLRTPVDTGRARGGWQVTINEPGTGGKIQDKKGGYVISLGAGRIAKAKVGDSIYITNGVEYILPLENGHSKRHPEGMVGITVAELKAELGI